MPPRRATVGNRAPARTQRAQPQHASAACKKEPGGLKRVGATSKNCRRAKAEKDDTKQKKRYKKWLKTPADWARFNAWAAINAQPKKYPEPEPIIRPSKPLPLLLKRIELLIELPKRTDLSVHCKSVETPVSKAALNAELTKRLLKLALPKYRLLDYGRELPTPICKATLCYNASRRIICLSQPVVREREECKPVAIPRDTKSKICARRRLCELVKKLGECPEGLTDEEREELFTSAGIRRTALEYKISSWMEFLALPWYKNIRPRRDKDAKEWKKIISAVLEERGKQALAQQRRRQEKGKRKRKKGKSKDASVGTTDDDENAEDSEAMKKRKKAMNAWRYAPLPYKSHSESFLVKKSALQKEASPRTIELAKAKERKDRTTKKKPFDVKKGALSATSTDRIAKLATPKMPLSPVDKWTPHEKDKYGRPIIPMPKYGKVLPKTKPYKMGECPKKEENAEEKKEKKEKPIDPIAYESTVDPYIYPDLAKKQKRERQRAEKIMAEKRERRKAKQDNKAGDGKQNEDEEN